MLMWQGLNQTTRSNYHKNLSHISGYLNHLFHTYARDTCYTKVLRDSNLGHLPHTHVTATCYTQILGLNFGVANLTWC